MSKVYVETELLQSNGQHLLYTDREKYFPRENFSSTRDFRYSLIVFSALRALFSLIRNSIILSSKFIKALKAIKLTFITVILRKKGKKKNYLQAHRKKNCRTWDRRRSGKEMTTHRILTCFIFAFECGNVCLLRICSSNRF